MRAAGRTGTALTQFALGALLYWRCFNRLIRRVGAPWWRTLLFVCGRLLFWLRFHHCRFLFCDSWFLFGRGGFLIGGLLSFEEILALKGENDLS